MQNIVLVGAGGTGMSGVAGMLYDLGFENLICIDATQSQLTDKLKEKGLQIIIGHGNYEVTVDDVVIYSEACVDSPEVQQAKSFGYNYKKPRFVMNYFEFLGEVSKYFKTVGFTGTNGKSTTTSMGLVIAKQSLPDFGLGILGALVPQLNGQNYVVNQNCKDDLTVIFTSIFSNKEIQDYDLIKKYYFLLEACEYKRHFLHLDLDYAIITNIHLDHTDYYVDEQDYISAFTSLLQNTRKHVLILDHVWQNLQIKLSSVELDIWKKKLIEVPESHFNFQYIFGKHQEYNGSLLHHLFHLLHRMEGKEEQQFLSVLESFRGLWRRMELLGTNQQGAKIFSDYGHIAESIEIGYHALHEQFPDKKLILIFQPHQIQRIIVGWDEFIEATSLYNEVIIYNIYAARENIFTILNKEKKMELQGVTSVKELGQVFSKSCGGYYLDDKNILLASLQQFSKDTIVIFFSAGNLDYIIRNTL